MELALARIEMNQDINPDAIHWEMFKNDCMEKEKEQIIDAANSVYEDKTTWGERYYNQTYNNGI